MTVRDVLRIGDPRLRAVARRVEDPAAPEVAGVVADLADTLRHWRTTTTYGRGIAAPQIGVPLRLVYLDLGEPWPMVNPAIVARSAATRVWWDACLSFDLRFFAEVVRADTVDVRYQDLDGNWHTVHGDDTLSELLQHELDHLDGVLASDRMTDPRTICLREEFELRYRNGSPYAE